MRFIFILLILSLPLNSGIVINELQPGPKNNEPEWIEIYNNSDDIIDLNGWYIFNYNSYKRINFTSIIKPKEFCIIVKDSNLIKSIKKIPDDARFIQIVPPSLHNSIDTISILNKDSILIDRFIYNYNWTSLGISLERIDTDEPALDRTNIGKSISIDSCTPGKKNSIAKKDFYINVKKNNDSTFTIKNLGMRLIELLNIEIYFKSRLNKEYSYFQDTNLKQLSKNDSINFVINLEKIRNLIENGLYDLLIEFKDDSRHINEIVNSTFYKSYNFNSLLINEFLPNPSSNNGEFIEFYNTTNFPICLKNYKILSLDSKNNKDTLLIDCENCLIKPQSYFLVIPDSSFFKKYYSLRNSENIWYRKTSLNLSSTSDFIGIIDYNNYYIDSLNYKSDWYNTKLSSTKDISIEKKNKNNLSNLISNWIASRDSSGATPLKVNSYDEDVIPDTSTKAFVAFNKNPFSRINYIDEPLKIEINSDKPIKYIRFSVFNMNGSLIKDLESKFINSKKIFSSFEGKDDRGISLDIGPYILFIAIEYENGNLEQQKHLIVIGE